MLPAPAFEPELGQIKRIDKRVHRANRIALIDPLIEAFGQQSRLSTIRPNQKRFIRSSRKSREYSDPRIKSSDAFSRSQGHSRPRRAGDNSGYVRYAAESGKIFIALATSGKTSYLWPRPT